MGLLDLAGKAKLLRSREDRLFLSYQCIDMLVIWSARVPWAVSWLPINSIPTVTDVHSAADQIDPARYWKLALRTTSVHLKQLFCACVDLRSEERLRSIFMTEAEDASFDASSLFSSIGAEIGFAHQSLNILSDSVAMTIGLATSPTCSGP